MSSCGAKAQQDPATLSPGHVRSAARRIRDHRIETGHFPAFLFLHLRLRLLLISSDWSIRLPQDNLRRLFCNFTGEVPCIAGDVRAISGPCHESGYGSRCSRAAEEKCMQFPGKMRGTGQWMGHRASRPKTIPSAMTPPVTAPQAHPALPIPMENPDASFTNRPGSQTRTHR